jgi:ribosomal protein S18 acetylase RimI-like enzyme
VTTDAATRQGSDASIGLRPIGQEDQPFLLALYSSTRQQELAVLPWDEAQKAAFLQMQFEAQHAQYQEHYAGASFDIILVGGQPAGRLYVKRGSEEFRIVDIALLPEFCNRGIGSTLLRQLQAEARAAGKPLTIHVERFNPALRLYERLGFRQIDDRGVYLFMEWKGDNPEAPGSPPPRAEGGRALATPRRSSPE